MTTDLAKLKELFVAAMKLPAAERTVYLDTACAGDTALREQIEGMLQSHENSGELLPRSPAEMLQDSGTTEADATAAFPVQTRGSSTQVEPSSVGVHDLNFLAPSSHPGHIGRLGHYEIMEVLGKGGFGIVLKAFDEKLHRAVAIKVLATAYAAVGSARARFIREARTAAAIKNEHVVAIHAVDDEAQPPYLVMEIIDGISLQDRLDKTGPLPVKEILRIGLQTAEGLAAAHKHGFMHRDIKPANILLENGVERVKITDFGLARAVDDASVSQSGTVAGTPMYMSPEQAEGLPIDHRSDLFSLGTVLYAMCTGHPPFRASGTHAVLKRVIDAAPRPIREVNNEIPDWLEAIIAKLHAKKPEDRFQTAKEVAELLGAKLADVQAGRAIELRAEPRKGPVEAPAADLWLRNRRIAAFGLAVIGIFFIITGLMLFNIPAERLNPAGVQWLIPSIGLATILGAVFLAFDSRRRYYMSASMLVAFGFVLAALEYANISHVFHTPIYTITLEVDDPDIVMSMFRQYPGEEEPAEFANHLARFKEAPVQVNHYHQAKQFALPAGKYWFTAELDGKVVHYELVNVDRSRNVYIPWAAEFVKKQKQALKGAWHAVSVERDGSAIPADMIAAVNFGLRFEGDRVTVRMSQTKETKAIDKEGAFTVDPRKKPATLDLIDAIDGKTMLCVYRCDGDTLEICGSPKERPSAFSTKLGSERMLFVLKRGEGASSKGFEEPGWVQLFNGKDLAGWKTLPQQLGDWRFVDGALIGQNGTSHLFTDRQDYVDFHLRFEAKLNAVGNSGVFFRCPFALPAKSPKGLVPGAFEADFQANGKEVSPGLLAYNGLKPPIAVVNIKPDVWFTEEIIAQGDRIVLKVNGVTTMDYKDSDRKFLRGPIALQCYGPETVVHFRKVEIKELPPEPVVVVKNALQFDGTNSHVSVPALRFATDEPITLEAWVKFDKVNGRAETIASTYSATSAILLCRTMGAGPTFLARRDLKAHFARTDDKSANTDWVHLAGVWDGKEARLYINGKLQSTKSTNNVLEKNAKVQDQHFLIGAEKVVPNQPVGFFFCGLMGPIRISNTARYATDFTPDVNFQLDTRTIALYRMDQTSGDKLLDSTSNHYHGTIVDAKWVTVPRPASMADPGWVQLFNGKDLTGWNYRPPTWLPVDERSKWAYDQNSLTLTGKVVGSTYLCSDRDDFENFELRGEVKVAKGFKASVCIHVNPDTAEWKGLVVNLAHSPESGQISLDSTDAFPSFGRIPIALKEGSWHSIEMKVRGNQVVVKFDGVAAFDVMLPPAVSKKHNVRGRLAIGIPPLGASVSMRNFEIKELPPAERGWVQLFNGKNLDGWKADPKQLKAWSVANGTLTGQGAVSYLFTDRLTFERFHLRVQAKINDKGRGGLNLYIPRVELPWGEKQASQGILVPINSTSKDNQLITGALLSMLPKTNTLVPSAKAAPRPDEWFELEFISVGRKLQVKINGETTAELTVNEDLPLNRYLGLAVRGDDSIVQFRKIEIKDLAP